MNHRNTYDELFQKLISGSINPEERYQLEKKALDDPLLFDAIEGISTVSGVPHNNHIRAIKKRLNSIARKKKIRRLLIPIAAAASILILFTIGKMLITDDSSSTSQDQMVINENDVLPLPSLENEIPVEPASNADIAVSENSVPLSNNKVQEPPPTKSIPEASNASNEDVSEDIVAIIETDESGLKEVVPESAEEITPNPAVGNVVIANREVEPLSKRARRNVPLSALKETLLKNDQADEAMRVAAELPSVDPLLISFLKEKYLDQYKSLPSGVRINFGITFNEKNSAEKVRIIDGDDQIGTRLVPFIKEYNNWKVQNLQLSQELQFLFTTEL